MFAKGMIRTASYAALSVMAVAFVGCSKDAEDAKPSTAPVPMTEADSNKLAIRAVLAKADLVDGEADHIVSKCAGCNLSMDGDAKHAFKSGGYKLLFCSADCKDSFTKDVRQSILALHVPED